MAGEGFAGRLFKALAREEHLSSALELGRRAPPQAGLLENGASLLWLQAQTQARQMTKKGAIVELEPGRVGQLRRACRGQQVGDVLKAGRHAESRRSLLSRLPE